MLVPLFVVCFVIVRHGESVPVEPNSVDINININSGPRPDPGVGADPSVGAGPGVGPDSGVGADTGAGAAPGMGIDPGFGVESGMGIDPGFGVDPGMGPDQGMGPDTGMGIDPAFKVDPAAAVMTGPDPIMGGKPSDFLPVGVSGTGIDQGFGVGLGLGAPERPVRPGGPGGQGGQVETTTEGSSLKAAYPKPAPLSQEQEWRNGNCSMFCNEPLCFLSHNVDCRRFTMCELSPEGHYSGTDSFCAHGAFWAGASRTMAHTNVGCDIPSRVQCGNDVCLNPQNDGGTYEHFKSCKQYWQCENGVSVPRCCPGYLQYDIVKGECVPDPTEECSPADCYSTPDLCKSPDIQSEPMDDDLCGTYWACVSGTPMPVCCPEGMRYNKASRICEESSRLNPCMDPCPDGYTLDSCLQGRTQFALSSDGHCTTYIKCLDPHPKTGAMRAQRRCCKRDYVFDAISNECVRAAGPLSCGDMTCPRGYIADCHLKRVPGDPSSYIDEANGIETVMPCSPGSSFDFDVCGCGIIIEGAGDYSCPVEFNLQMHFPKFINYGSQDMMYIQPFGTPTPGSILNNQTTYHFDGNVRFNIDFFKQSLPKLFIQLDYLPEAKGLSGKKKVVVSNCRQVEAFANDPSGTGPSLEVAIENREISFFAMTPNGQILLKTDISLGKWNQFKAIYNGNYVLITNQAFDEPRPKEQYGKLSGDINVAAEGLEIGDCKIRENREGYVGDLAKVVVSKCLDAEQRKLMKALEAEARAIEEAAAKEMGPII